jgi:hypothetical protein
MRDRQSLDALWSIHRHLGAGHGNGHHSYECSTLARSVGSIFLAYNWGVIEKTSVKGTIKVALARLQGSPSAPLLRGASIFVASFDVFLKRNTRQRCKRYLWVH